MVSEALAAQLVAKEERHRRIMDFTQRFQEPVVVLKLNIPGARKGAEKYRRVFDAAEKQLKEQLGDRILFHRTRHPHTGSESFLIVKEEAQALKREMVDVEESSPLGRLYDLDVYAPHLLHRKDLGLEERRCFLCDRPAFECARSRRHKPWELERFIDGLIHTLKNH